MGAAAIASIFTGLQAVTSVQQQRQAYKAQAAAYEAQAKAAEQNAAIQSKKRELEADDYAQQQRKLTDAMKLARGRALAAAGSGGYTSDGSVNDILDASEDQYKQDSMNLLSQQRISSWNNYVNEVNYRNQASSYKTAAQNTKVQGRMGIASTILGAAASLYALNSGGGSAAKNTGTTNTATSGNVWVGSTPYSAAKKAGTLSSGQWFY